MSNSLSRRSLLKNIALAAGTAVAANAAGAATTAPAAAPAKPAAAGAAKPAAAPAAGPVKLTLSLTDEAGNQLTVKRQAKLPRLPVVKKHH